VSESAGVSAEETRPLVSVLVPAYNEKPIVEKNLGLLFDYLRGLEERYRWEIVLVDDGSTDGTGEAADRFAEGREGVRVIHHPSNMRLGQALRTGFEHCRGDYVVTMDLDLSYVLHHIETLLGTIRATGAQIAIASPYMKGGRVSHVPWLRRKLSRWANRFLSFASRENIATMTGMVRAYEAGFLKRLALKAMNIDIHTEIIYKARILRARIVEIPAHLDWGPLRETGEGRESSIRISSSVVWNMLSGFMFRPFMFLILTGFLFLAASLYPLGWAMIHTVTALQEMAPAGGTPAGRLSAAVAEAFVQSPHSFIVGGFALMVSVQLIGLGMTALQNHRYFKDLYHLVGTFYGSWKEGPWSAGSGAAAAAHHGETRRERVYRRAAPYEENGEASWTGKNARR
jgi:glycosyltransferase involved in cell wall biosynthesis